jgi:hypothetical protein
MVNAGLTKSTSDPQTIPDFAAISMASGAFELLLSE